ncbi:RHS repeat-associated core domain protein-containing protein [Pseudomonas reidholzensis]|uniref:RHS repeat-associated core domain protein-containing protein n=1 Tax=Pseudomonas reidholzensis TaxID=1785162 RepID=A0A383RRP6_9PSED|nr:RHS repeat-associated core domain-containing protein [Pseudomonas reidholzensis]SYX89740.1 RHS repeat-associated core domain protein-containing protein [Pseudomonas reidholzensis]
MSSSKQFFYCGRQLVHSLQVQDSQRFFRQGQRPLAGISQSPDRRDSTLVYTDPGNSVLGAHLRQQINALDYTAYGYCEPPTSAAALLAFNGELLDTHAHFYLLGQGRRAYNPAVMRFNSPDSLSPFRQGGVNAYAYCHGDPINYADPLGTSIIGRMTSAFERGLKNLGTRGLRNRINQYDNGAAVTHAGARLGSDRREATSIINSYEGVEMIHRMDRVEPDLYTHPALNYPQSSLMEMHNSIKKIGLEPNPATSKWLTDMSRNATMKHHDAIMAGRHSNYLDDTRLSLDDTYKVMIFDHRIMNARYLPNPRRTPESLSKDFIFRRDVSIIRQGMLADYDPNLDRVLDDLRASGLR